MGPDSYRLDVVPLQKLFNHADGSRFAAGVIMQIRSAQ
jgi:hypothetical protein